MLLTISALLIGKYKHIFLQKQIRTTINLTHSHCFLAEFATIMADTTTAFLNQNKSVAVVQAARSSYSYIHGENSTNSFSNLYQYTIF